MADLFLSLGALDRHDIEAIAVPFPAVSGDPDPGQAFDDPALFLADGFLGGAEVSVSSGFDFDERHQGPPTGDDVDVVVSEVKTVGFDEPPFPGEPGDDPLLDFEAEDVTSVGPAGTINTLEHVRRSVARRSAAQQGDAGRH